MIKEFIESHYRQLLRPTIWPLAVVGVSLLLASIFVLFKLHGAAKIVGLIAFVFIAIFIAFRIVDEASSIGWLTRNQQRIRRGLVVLAVILIGVESIFILGQGVLSAPDEIELPAEVADEDFVKFAGTLDLAQRYKAKSGTTPLLKATPDQPAERTISFTAPTSGAYRLAVQLEDSPFVDRAQPESDYLTIVDQGRSLGQTFVVSDRMSTLSGLRIKLEARSIVNNLPGTSAPDAPLLVNIRRLFDHSESEQVFTTSLDPEVAGLNDDWRWVTIPLDVEVTAGQSREFLVEFTSSAQFVGWALSHVTNSWKSVDDYYEDGQLYVDRQLYELGGDLAFEILGRNEQAADSRLTVDGSLLELEALDEDDDWYLSQAVRIEEGKEHTLTISSSNPHLGFYRFVFVQERTGIESSAPGPLP